MKTQRILLIMIALMLLYSASQGQSFIGLGVNFSSVYDSDLPLEHRYSSSPAITLGRQFGGESKLKAIIELQYSVKGFRIKGAYIDDGTFIPQANSNLRIHYLDFVPTLEFPFINKFNVIIGADAAFKLLDTYNDIQLQEFKMKPHQPFDYGYVIGGKIAYKQYWLRATLNKGLTNIAESGSGNQYKNINVQLVLGFKIQKY